MSSNKKPKTQIDYFLQLIYIAPENAVDANGEPIKIYPRYIELDKKSYERVVSEMEQGKTDLFIPQSIKMMDGSQRKQMTYVNLHNRELIRASTFIQEFVPEEEAKKQQDSGKTVLYRPDGRAYTGGKIN